eukprot:CAMPEP_0172319552 /NCGR_PEP_ID=MMETSP1058-20130122/37971_1 /TAXON_ID=83371 /ORGANISM="Detonula confervacea, Strain CCMP 353" /LENGTH=57 /DNA_ID=CAMNT_0013034627 /DNA_START=245 /DNA_END=415 /DNA_ORIENTATION=-
MRRRGGADVQGQSLFDSNELSLGLDEMIASFPLSSFALLFCNRALKAIPDPEDNSST